jgi:hypothetical protein
VADEPEIPADLIALQRRFDAAHAAVVAASAHPGPVADWPADAVAELRRAREAERQATVDLYRAREGTPFAAYPAQERLRDAAAEQG